MDRREFVVTTGLGLLSAACGPRSGAEKPTLDCDPDRFRIENIASPPEALTRDMRDVVAFMRTNGWFELLGWSDAPPDPLAQSYLDPRRVPTHAGFLDFASQPLNIARPIYPGRPELSLLYHALASRAVTLPNGGEEAYPTLTQLDTVENFIYSLHVPPVKDSGGNAIKYVLAVLAYEYRPAGQTPHGLHADLVFSRTGIARVGTGALNYQRATREHANWPGGDENSSEIAVTGARYALFLARDVNDKAVEARKFERDDGNRRFLLPERKLFSGDPFIKGSTVRFVHRHVTERLKRLASYRPHDAPPLEVRPSDHDQPPFRRVAISSDSDAPSKDLNRLVDLTRYGSSVVLSSAPARLVREARTISGERVRLRVPRDTKGISRQYTTLELDYTGRLTALREAIALRRRANFIELRRPNDAPMLVNIRDEVTADGEKVGHIDDEAKIAKGDYWAGLFEDSICDGCIAANLEPTLADSTWGVLRTVPRPAYSIVAAPDFFPNATGLELDNDDPELSGNFLKGGTIPLSSVRLPPNRTLVSPVTDRGAFATNDRADDTATAVVSRASARASKDPKTDDGHRRSGYLPDSASGIFYPGWDVTYDAANGESFLTTYGLGSPFVEDLKLCAAANGMWPAASPDSARTYQGSLIGVPAPLIGGYYYSRTAVPLTDLELGYHPASPAAKKLREVAGWDGEYGPFLDADATHTGVLINYADINRVDQVQNVIAGKLDAGKLRRLTTRRLIDRMDALRRVIARLHSGGMKVDGVQVDKLEVYQTPYWLISFEEVDWAKGTSVPAIPDVLRASGDPWGTPRSGITGHGYIMVLALPVELSRERPIRTSNGRVVRPCTELVVAQVSQRLQDSHGRSNIAWAKWNVAKGSSTATWEVTDSE